MSACGSQLGAGEDFTLGWLMEAHWELVCVCVRACARLCVHSYVRACMAGGS